MTIYITGASGFIGARLLSTLQAQERDVVTIARDRRDQVLTSGEICLDSCVLADFDRMSRKVLVHCAGRAHVLDEPSADPLVEYREAHVALTLRLARLAAEAGFGRFVFLSSIKVNGEATAPGSSFTSSDDPLPVDAYGRSKLEAEQALRALARATGMEVVIIRPVLVYGPGAKGNLRSMLNWLERGVPLPLAAVENRRSLLALDNLIDLITTCVDHPAAANQTFLAADGEDVSTPELLRRTARVLGRSTRLFPVPVGGLQWVAGLLGRQDQVRRLCGSLQVDISHTCRTLGWRPPLSLDQGLRLLAEDR
jgi:nucleoside-diphosphate-sugar epimerase